MAKAHEDQGPDVSTTVNVLSLFWEAAYNTLSPILRALQSTEPMKTQCPSKS